MKSNPHRYLVLVIDFDDQKDRRAIAEARIPSDLSDRVLVIGSLREPEDLKKAIGCPLEQIGQQLATECRDAYENFWAHELLAHNQSEITRLRDAIHPILFPIATGP